MSYGWDDLLIINVLPLFSIRTSYLPFILPPKIMALLFWLTVMTQVTYHNMFLIQVLSHHSHNHCSFQHLMYQAYGLLPRLKA